MYIFGRLTDDIVRTEPWLQDNEEERVPYKKNTWLLLKPKMENGRFTAEFSVIASVDTTVKWIGKESISIHPCEDKLKPEYVNPYLEDGSNTNSNISMDNIITFEDDVGLDKALMDISNLITYGVGFEEND